MFALVSAMALISGLALGDLNCAVIQTVVLMAVSAALMGMSTLMAMLVLLAGSALLAVSTLMAVWTLIVESTLVSVSTSMAMVMPTSMAVLGSLLCPLGFRPCRSH